MTAPLLNDRAEARRSQEDTTGFRSFSKGYVVSGVLVRRRVAAGQSLRVHVSGQVDGEVQSQLVLRYRLDDGTTLDQAALVNQFASTWNEVSEM